MQVQGRNISHLLHRKNILQIQNNPIVSASASASAKGCVHKFSSFRLRTSSSNQPRISAEPKLIEAPQSIDTQGTQSNSHEKILNDFLPTYIQGLEVKRLGWSDFPAEPNQKQWFSAHIYWSITYTYNVTNVGETFKVKELNPSVHVNKTSWVRHESDWLLSHEQGHYLIGCLCALEFKKLAMMENFTPNYKTEILQLLRKVIGQFSETERKYDDKTAHGMDDEKQEKWYNFFFLSFKNLQSNVKPRKSITNENTCQPIIKKKSEFQLPKIPRSPIKQIKLILPSNSPVRRLSKNGFQ